MTRKMLYRGFPNQFTRMRIFKYGEEVATEEVIVYQENCIHAQQERGIVITADTLMCDIDEYKNIGRQSTFQKKPWGLLSSKNKAFFKTVYPYILMGIVLLYAFASNGWQIT